MLKNKNSVTITAPKGLVPFLKREVEQLGYPIVWASESAVGTNAGYDDCMHLNLWLRTAHHVLFELCSFPCNSLDDLYRGVRAYAWENVIDENGYLSVVATVSHPSIRDHRIVNLKCKDAIVDRISECRGRRPDSGSDRRETVITVFWQQDRCSIAVDTSGEALSKRGYRKIPLAAPMQETLAAAVVAATGYDGSQPFVNPMCGSGTLAIEAALAATGAAPGLTRDYYGFMYTKLYREESWLALKREAVGAKRTHRQPQRIIAADMSVEAVDAARRNAEAAGVDACIEFHTGDFTQTPVPDGEGIVLFNPEYGMRLGNQETLVATYRSIGSFMKQSCAGYNGYIFTGNPALAGKVGLKAGRKWNFLSGKIDCRLYEYALFKGKKV